MVASDLFCLSGFCRSGRRGPGLRVNTERKKEAILFLFVLLHILGGVSSQLVQQSPCPTSCVCSEASRTVKCEKKDLNVVPQNIPPYVQNLTITGNNISTLNRAFRQEQPLSELSNLDLSDNHLQELGSNVFSYLPSLTYLDLSNNDLGIISNLSFQVDGSGSIPLKELKISNSFKNEFLISMLAKSFDIGAPRKLEKLELSGNDILFLPKGMFSPLPNLRHINLSNNSLTSFSADIFKDLSHLETLDLSNNALKRLRNATSFDLISQKNLLINLNDNSWECDCMIEEFSRWLKDTKLVKESSSLVCAFPENMKDRAIVELNISELKCPEPDDNTSLQTSYVFLGIVLALIGVIFLLVLYLNRKGIKKWIYNIRDACRDHMEGYHYRYEINADPRLTNVSTNSDV
ncbi:hypothetical protein XENTR_v10014215 [Xenopus tropicalis]|uniref:Trophoblast glycoprotein n=1 Tax=Xenopus tropicalis TaxID=8364 RepID=A0A803JUJ1_XENTR|nr:trophoblast glycoprotein [Xenopus tropicalis]KAE8603099.1 hypothetical protein XENTR_v10014215 [Xenopus tropicalis]|eukprot:XP_017949811.1 PREDICTED: trophoblast glycoprotein [Xenopus tropicalis]